MTVMMLGGVMFGVALHRWWAEVGDDTVNALLMAFGILLISLGGFLYK